MTTSPFHTIVHIGTGIKESLIATCSLVIFLQKDRIYYLLISPQSEVVLCKECVNIRDISEEMFFRFVLERETLLTSPFLECKVYISHSDITLIPNEFWKKELELPLCQLMMSEHLENEEIYSTAIDQASARVLFTIPSGLIHLLDRYIRHYELSHIAVPMVEEAYRLSRKDRSLIMFLVLNHRFAIVAMRDGNLQLCNVYPYHTVSDMLYYIQVARETTGLTQSGVPVFCIGEMKPDAEEQQGLWQLIPGLSFPEPPHQMSENGEISWWKFSFLASDYMPV